MEISDSNSDSSITEENEIRLAFDNYNILNLTERDIEFKASFSKSSKLYLALHSNFEF